MDKKIELRCPIMTPITLSIPYMVDEQSESKYTQDPRALHMLKQGLLVYVTNGGNEITSASELDLEKLRLSDLSSDGISYWIDDFGYRNHMDYVWVSPQAVSYFGEERIMQELPRAIKKLLFHDELKVFCTGKSSIIS